MMSSFGSALAFVGCIWVNIATAIDKSTFSCNSGITLRGLNGELDTTFMLYDGFALNSPFIGDISQAEIPDHAEWLINWKTGDVPKTAPLMSQTEIPFLMHWGCNIIPEKASDPGYNLCGQPYSSKKSSNTEWVIVKTPVGTLYTDYWHRGPLSNSSILPKLKVVASCVQGCPNAGHLEKYPSATPGSSDKRLVGSWSGNGSYTTQWAMHDGILRGPSDVVVENTVSATASCCAPEPTKCDNHRCDHGRLGCQFDSCCEWQSGPLWPFKDGCYRIDDDGEGGRNCKHPVESEPQQYSDYPRVPIGVFFTEANAVVV